MISLAERLIDHCSPANRADGFGSIVSCTFPLRDIIARYVSQRIKITDGIDLSIPEGCTWNAGDLADGSVALTFNGNLPVVSIKAGLLQIHPHLTALVIRIGSAAIEVQAHAKLGFIPVPSYTLTFPLGSSARDGTA